MGSCLSRFRRNDDANSQSVVLASQNTDDNILPKFPPPIKKALVVGLNYEGTRAALKGCINDAKNLKKLLIKKYEYKNVEILTDKELSRKKNVLESFTQFLEQPSDIMVFHYSGHGTQKVDLDGDEPDGKDEALYTKYGVLMDDDTINSVIKKVPEKVKLVVFIDACHSGSVLDLPWQLKDNDTVERVSGKEVAADVICITGCRDDQVSMDIQAGLFSYGALSNALSDLLATVDPKVTTWRQLQEQLRAKMKAGKYAQISQLCVSRRELLDEIICL